MEELKPCPFCGGEAEYWHAQYHHVGCKDPSCAGYRCGITGYDDEDEPTRRWNTRSDYAVQAENERRIEQREAERTCEAIGDRCSLCHAELPYYYDGGGTARPPRYCPDCGAKVLQ